MSIRRSWLTVMLLALAVHAGAAVPVDQGLAERIAKAPPGATIRVAAGIHPGGLVISKPLTLIGDAGAILDGDSRGDVIRIAASHVTIRGLTVRNSGTDLTAMNAGIFVAQKATDVDVLDNTLLHVLFGVYLDGPSRVRVVGNHIEGLREVRSPDRGDGIHLWNDTDVEVRDNDIGFTRDGIYIYISHHNRIVGNHIHDLRYGIHYMYAHHNDVIGNVTSRTRAGFALMQSKDLRILNNRSEHDREYGILMNYITYSELAGNVVVDVNSGSGGADLLPDQGKGIFVYNSVFNKIHGNYVAHCPIGIHVTAGSEHNRVYGNAFVDNRRQVKYVQNRKEEWSWRGRGNYWSDYMGWDLNGDGLGDVVFRPNDGVDILIWKYPRARLLMNSPAVLALRAVQRAFPVFTPPTVEDDHPLMHLSEVNELSHDHSH